MSDETNPARAGGGAGLPPHRERPRRDDVRRVTDVETLKAVAHPLRTRLLASLRVDGPATASELARRFGESSGSTSYHLRQLERYGFIEQDPEQRNARERRWRALHALTSWSNAEMRETPEGREATAFMRRRHLQSVVETAERFEAEIEDWSPEWVETLGLSDEVVRLTPAALHEVRRRLEEMVHELAADPGDPGDGSELIMLTLAAFPARGYA
ncbi:helix-turn-helix domain-containing protein [Bailinhaonella thermotolerans]|uniref:MarR family transcriptional regulator n=1 Tax=Bailinhaonella thermotolerans TaxID=1070861 RepID=A0A3A4B0L1_9ACTN|nr:helix-turn-helix domain-containing protein [Bailinhaonella thermotolerans]RJL25152.1 MarR family transcriptional regulator [Bailinhaonella thermotolerans]